MKVEFKSSVIFVSDIERSKKFYLDFIGLEIEMDHGPCVGFNCGLSIWEKNHVENILFQNKKELTTPLGQLNLELYFETENLDDIADVIEKEDIPIVTPLETAPWGQRTIRFTDPDGHILEVGETLTVVIKRFRKDGLNDAEVASRMGMPIEAIQYLGGL